MYQTLVVVDSDELQTDEPHFNPVSFVQYLNDYPKRHEHKTRVINLCDTEHYLSRGYYCSLLAEARQHRVLPSVGTINDLRDLAQHDGGFNLAMPQALLGVTAEGDHLEIPVYFGWVEDSTWQKLARHVYDKFPAPILYLTLDHESHGVRLQVRRHAYAQLPDSQRPLFLNRLQLFTEKDWRTRGSKRRHRWDMAILVNPKETQPPSDKEAITRFIKAAEKVGIHAEIIAPHQAAQISQYDALFIRETTAIDHHSYRLARKAEQEGLVVMDDPSSILRCCNKVFLHDAFTYNRVPSLKTRVVIGSDDADLYELESQFEYPLVLKMPEGSFSRGVFKIQNRQELQHKLNELLADTALVLAQEYLYTDFDWRVGVLNGRAIYACKYFMARNHWQIYNQNAKRFVSGDFETLPTFEVPKAVLDAAIKSANMVGKGLYGVDLKQKDHQVYVIEVNDNPSIEHKVEDRYLGKELYMLIMAEFAQRLEQRGR